MDSAVTAPAFTVVELPAGERNLIGLARVSTDAQDAQMQQDALTEAGCGRIYTEKVSTRQAASGRQGLAAALGYLRPGDTLVVWKLDRLGRSVKEVLTIADDLHARGVGVRILTGKLSGSYSPHGEGKFFFTMMAAFAELERDIIYERTMAGLKAARAQGKVGGRPPPSWTRTSSPLPGRAGPAARAPRRSPRRSASAAHRYTGTSEVRPGRPRPGRDSGHSPACAGGAHACGNPCRCNAGSDQPGTCARADSDRATPQLAFVDPAGFSTRFPGSRRLPEIRIGTRPGGCLLIAHVNTIVVSY